MILITGATGTTGGATLEALTRSGQPLRVLVRNPDKFAARDGVEIAVGQFEDADSLDKALKGVDHAYLVSPPGPEQVGQATAFIEAAKRNGVHHIVRLSAIGVDAPGAGSHRLGASHAAVERVLLESGVAWTILRPNGFMQNYLMQAQPIITQGVFYSSLSPNARISHVDARDIGEVAAAALTDTGHEGKGYTLTGPEALSDDEVAERLSTGLGREIKHQQVPAVAVMQGMRDVGMSEWLADGLAELFEVYETGVAAVTTPDVGEVVGRKPRSLADFAHDHRHLLGG